MPNVYHNQLRIKLITKGANWELFYLTVEVAVPYCRSWPYVYMASCTDLF